MLFKGVSQHFSSLGAVVEEKCNKTDDAAAAQRIRSVRLQGNGTFMPIALAKDAANNNPIPAEADLQCLGCSRASRLIGQCQNCNTVELCEHCGFGCSVSDCNEALCSNCVNLL